MLKAKVKGKGNTDTPIQGKGKEKEKLKELDAGEMEELRVSDWLSPREYRHV